MWIKINDTLQALEDISTIHLTPGQAEMVTRNGRRLTFSGPEPAEALALFAATLKPLDLNAMFKHAQAAAGQEEDQKYSAATQKQITGLVHDAASCPLRDMHEELTILCPACGVPLINAGKPTTQSSPPTRPLTTPNTLRGLKTPPVLT